MTTMTTMTNPTNPTNLSNTLKQAVLNVVVPLIRPTGDSSNEITCDEQVAVVASCVEDNDSTATRTALRRLAVFWARCPQCPPQLRFPAFATFVLGLSGPTHTSTTFKTSSHSLEDVVATDLAVADVAAHHVALAAASASSSLASSAAIDSLAAAITTWDSFRLLLARFPTRKSPFGSAGSVIMCKTLSPNIDPSEMHLFIDTNDDNVNNDNDNSSEHSILPVVVPTLNVSKQLHSTDNANTSAIIDPRLATINDSLSTVADAAPAAEDYPVKRATIDETPDDDMQPTVLERHTLSMEEIFQPLESLDVDAFNVALLSEEKLPRSLTHDHILPSTTSNQSRGVGSRTPGYAGMLSINTSVSDSASVMDTDTESRKPKFLKRITRGAKTLRKNVSDSFRASLVQPANATNVSTTHQNKFTPSRTVSTDTINFTTTTATTAKNGKTTLNTVSESSKTVIQSFRPIPTSAVSSSGSSFIADAFGDTGHKGDDLLSNSNAKLENDSNNETGIQKDNTINYNGMLETSKATDELANANNNNNNNNNNNKLESSKDPDSLSLNSHVSSLSDDYDDGSTRQEKELSFNKPQSVLTIPASRAPSSNHGAITQDDRLGVGMSSTAIDTNKPVWYSMQSKLEIFPVDGSQTVIDQERYKQTISSSYGKRMGRAYYPEDATLIRKRIELADSLKSLVSFPVSEDLGVLGNFIDNNNDDVSTSDKNVELADEQASKGENVKDSTSTSAISRSKEPRVGKKTILESSEIVSTNTLETKENNLIPNSGKQSHDSELYSSMTILIDNFNGSSRQIANAAEASGSNVRTSHNGIEADGSDNSSGSRIDIEIPTGMSLAVEVPGREVLNEKKNSTTTSSASDGIRKPTKRFSNSNLSVTLVELEPVKEE